MMIGNNVSYIKAYTEVNCLLEYLPQSYIDKLPKKLVELIQKQSNEQYNINIDTNKSLLEQNFSKKTKDLIAVIKYNPNDIFKKKETKTEIPKEEVIENTSQMVVYKENIFTRFLNKIRNIFRRK